MGQKDKAEQAVAKIVSNQAENGSFCQAKTSITRSSGKSLLIETTSLAILSMLRVDSLKWENQIKQGVDFIMSKMKGGYFGSTQATILAMKALVEFMSVSAIPSDESLFEVFIENTAYLMKIGDSMNNPDKGILINITNIRSKPTLH